MRKHELSLAAIGSQTVSPLGGTIPVFDEFHAVRRLRAAVWIFDIDASCILYANEAACALWQANNEAELCARDLKSDMSSTVAKRLQQYRADFLDRDATFTEMWTLYPNGEPSSVMVVFSGYRLADGRMAMQCEVVGNGDDSPQNLRSAEALLHTDVMITLFSKDGPPLYMNPAARNAAGRNLKCFADIFVEPADYATLMVELEVSNEHRAVIQSVTSCGPRWYDISVKTCSDAVTGQPAILVTAIDVSELKNARDKARFLADRDQLTGCYNRAYLQHHFSKLSNRRFEGKCAILYFDIDRFKQINDRFGHEMGDQVLRNITDRAYRVIRDGDIVARLGGDEFVVLFENISNEEDLAPEVERLRLAVSQPVHLDATRVNVTVSMGVALFTPDQADFTEIMREADIALYASKVAGRNCTTFFNDAMGAAARDRNLIESELQLALEQEQFVLYYQPRVDLVSGKVVSAEALVRWQHPTRGLIMPNHFIPICEETGMIEDLGQLILKIGCEQAMKWHRAGRDIELSINISPRQFDDERLMKSLQAYANTSGFPRNKIELEITENVLIGDHKIIAEKLTAITKMGFRIAIDDFGSGYSNLSYISRFPLNCIKVDRSFVDQLPESGPIISLILTLAQQIGAVTVAEGVETQDQLDWLAGQDCDQVQGYYLSRPVAADVFDAVVHKLDSARGHLTDKA